MTDKQFKSVNEALEDANKRMKSEGVQMDEPTDAYFKNSFNKDKAELIAKWRAHELGIEYESPQNYTTFKRRVDELTTKVETNAVSEQDFINFASMLTTMTANPVWWDDLFPRVSRII